MANVLIVEDELDISDVLADAIRRDGHHVACAVTGTEALGMLSLHAYDLVILDWMLPELSGIDVCKRYRAAGGQAHVMMLTAKLFVDDKELALNVGADDYVCKPFHLRELLARVKAHLRRPATLVNDVIDFAGWQLDAQAGKLLHADKIVRLLPREVELLQFLLKYKGTYFTAEALLNRVWPATSNAQVETVRTHIKNIRRKLDRPDFNSGIEHSRGYGYRIPA